ncbi:hypothetical protein [Devosia chinhatensis]|uniref:Uncharacterized protein n=1 Tax=Devosia chinhatensis TaxID=429727 RepID=A0A0F5FEE3_9HYPH|nr:hypothetical protein [Devosia chinhatensis]KKB07221.1 hypothetical protein VE26_10375 [Devosia chinhatensis]
MPEKSGPSESPAPSDLPRLGPRSINAYNRLARELAAFNYVLRHTKASGPVTASTLFTLNGLILSARRLFRRHPDMPVFFPVDIGQPMTLTDLNILVARLNAASLHFEERYAHLQGKLGRAVRRIG